MISDEGGVHEVGVVSHFLIFSDRGGGGAEHILPYITKSKKHANMPRFLLLFISLYGMFLVSLYSLLTE